jgi:hypothetical protein
MFEQGLFSLLSNDVGIKAALGGSPFGRTDGAAGVFPMQLPEASTLPAIVYSVLSSYRVTSMQGTNRTEKRRLQVDCYGHHYEDAKLLMQPIKDCLLSFRGPLADGTYMQGAFLIGELDAFEDAPFLYRGVLDFDVWIANI